MSEKAEASLRERRSIPTPLADRNSNASNSFSEHRIPRPDSKRRRRRNPFSDRERNNFPDIDEMFQSMKVSSAGLVGGDNSYDGKPFDEEAEDDGCCQQSDIDDSSFLRMSIGARAALNEHARFIAKHGIDGEITSGETELNNSAISEAGTNVLLDNQWEKILDLSRVASSVGGSVSEGIPSPPNLTTINLYFEGSSGEKSTIEESTSIEVMTDVSFDYFNSSRVNMLITPERNRNRQAEIVLTRDGVGADDSPQNGQQGVLSGSEQENLGRQNENEIEDSFLRLSLGNLLYANNKDVQGSSFNLGDISRISNNTVSDANYNLDASFQKEGQRDLRIGVDENRQNDDNGFGFADVFGIESPSIIINDSSFLSTPGGNEKHNASPSSKDPILSIEDASAQKSIQTSSSVQSLVSTFITEACNFAEQVAIDLEKSVVGGMESLPIEFLEGIDIGDSIDAPSPISQVYSSSPSSRQEASTRNHTPSTSTSSAREVTPPMHLTGRKLYRTVVPRRVYLEESTEQFSEEQSISIVVQSDPETTLVGRSLLESFEVVLTSKSY